MDNLEFLDGSKESVEAAPVEETREEATPQPEAPAEPEAKEQPRNDKGQFVKPPEEAPAQPDQAVPEVQPVPKEDQIMVPLAALHETRDKVKVLEAQLAQFSQAAQPQLQPVEVPDPFTDPEGFAAHQTRLVNDQILNTKLDISEEMARSAHGDATVDAARDWGLAQFQTNPAFRAEVLSQRNPYGYLVQQHQRQESLSQLSDPEEIRAFIAWKQAQGAVQQAAPAVIPQVPTPPPSIASAPSAGGTQHVATGPGVAFDEVMRK